MMKCYIVLYNFDIKHNNLLTVILMNRHVLVFEVLKGSGLDSVTKFCIV